MLNQIVGKKKLLVIAILFLTGIVTVSVLLNHEDDYSELDTKYSVTFSNYSYFEPYGSVIYTFDEEGNTTGKHSFEGVHESVPVIYDGSDILFFDHNTEYVYSPNLGFKDKNEISCGNVSIAGGLNQGYIESNDEYYLLINEGIVNDEYLSKILIKEKNGSYTCTDIDGFAPVSPMNSDGKLVMLLERFGDESGVYVGIFDLNTREIEYIKTSVNSSDISIDGSLVHFQDKIYVSYIQNDKSVGVLEIDINTGVTNDFHQFIDDDVQNSKVTGLRLIDDKLVHISKTGILLYFDLEGNLLEKVYIEEIRKHLVSGKDYISNMEVRYQNDLLYYTVYSEEKNTFFFGTYDLSSKDNISNVKLNGIDFDEFTRMRVNSIEVID